VPPLDRTRGFQAFRSRGPVAADRLTSSIGGFVADRAVAPLLVVVSTPSLACLPRVVEAHEPVCVQTFGAELAVKGFDEGIVRRLAWPGEVERDAALVSPQIQIALGALIDADRCRETPSCRVVRWVSAILIVTRQNGGQVKFVPNQVADEMSDMISRYKFTSDGGSSQPWSTPNCERSLFKS
jgi:hypothetical protein